MCADETCDLEAHVDFIAKWIDVFPDILNMRVDERGGLLHFAIRFASKSATKMLVKKGADLTLTCSRGYDALFYSVVVGHRSCMSLLLELGANPNTSNKLTGMSLLGYFAEKFGKHGWGEWVKADVAPIRRNTYVYRSHCWDVVAADAMVELIKYKADLAADVSFGSSDGAVMSNVPSVSERSVTAMQLLQGPRLWPSGFLSEHIGKVFAAWEMGPHPSQRWRRRGAFMHFAVEIGLRPLAARRKKLEDNMLPTDARIPKVEGERRDIVRDRALSDLFILKRIMSYL